MESMRRQLSTSLPRQHNEPDLLSEFKAAARSVTNLYKTAATSQKQTRAAGYQDALEDLLAFLDKENIGLMDGEGWLIRRWATERLDIDGLGLRQTPGSGSTLTDDEDGNSTSREEDRREERSSSPESQRKPHPDPIPDREASEDNAARQIRVSSEPVQQLIPTITHPQESSAHGDFTFRSSQAYPSNHNRDSNTITMDLDKSNSASPIFTDLPPIANHDAVRILPRATRNGRHAIHSRRNDSRNPTMSFNIGVGAGNKRRLPFPDFFDISGFQDGSDRKEGGGGKRSRHT